MKGDFGEMINNISDNKLMDSFHTFMPYFKYFLGEELGFTISNTERFLLVENSENLKINYKAGDLIPKNSAADECLKKKEIIHIMIPQSVFGFPVETIGIPVFVDNKIEGTMIVSMSVDKTVTREKVLNLAAALSQALNQMTDNVVEMSNTFQEINETNSGIEKFIEETKENSNKTDEVLSFIQNIAKQTNLLGLNAAIESARAGEYGKGFGVVSSEIRNLSNSTKESTEQINQILNNIRNSINKIYEKFQKSNELLCMETSALQEVTATIEELSSTATLLDEFSNEI